MTIAPGIIGAHAESHITKAQIESALLPLGLTLDLFNAEQEIMGRGKVTQLIIIVPAGSEALWAKTLTSKVPFIIEVEVAPIIDPYSW